MQLAKSIMLKKIGFIKILFSVFLLCFSLTLFAQSNSPYSRYGLGDLSPRSNINTRGMGSISAGYADILSVNSNNPASYSQFQTFIEQRSKKVAQGRVVFDVGINMENRTLIQPNNANKFTSSDLLFSHLQVGLPITRHWGMAFGIRPISRVGYLINDTAQVRDANTNQPIENAVTQFRGSGGAYLPTIGTGVSVKNFSIGFNAGYLFGNRENTTLRSLINDSLLYYSSEHSITTSYGHLFFNAGIQYAITLKDDKKGNNTILRLGLDGNLQQNLNASRDVLNQTFTRGSAGEELRIDSVFQNTGDKGTIVYPASYTAGFVLQNVKTNGSGWLIGADLTKNKWSQYRFYGQTDDVKDNWMLNVGGQVSPRPKENYFSRVAYRFGFFTGPDYVVVQNKLPQVGMSFGLGLPLPNYNRLSQSQYTLVNIALEYGKRGNDNNLLKENLFRLSIGVNFTDLWFGKRTFQND